MTRLILMLLFLSRVASADGDAGQGERTYDRICAECHTAPAAMHRMTELGTNDMEARLHAFLPLHRDITEAQLTDLIAYLLQVPAN